MDRLSDGYRQIAEACITHAQALEMQILALQVQVRALKRQRDTFAAMADLLDPPNLKQPKSWPVIADRLGLDEPEPPT